MGSVEAVRKINSLAPLTVKVLRVIHEVPDVKTFWLEMPAGVVLDVLPGQLIMVSVFGVGEAMFSASLVEGHLEISVKKVGTVTEELFMLSQGETVGIRGPFGNGFPLDACLGKNILFVAGGIGLPPIRSMVRWCLAHRQDFGGLHLVYGARSSSELVFRDELLIEWPQQHDLKVSVTVDRGSDEWTGHIGLVPDIVRKINPTVADTICIVCGPPIMIKFTLAALTDLGFSPDVVFTTLEMRMKCGVGKCGRCNIGSCYVCLDGPVFSAAQLLRMPSEY